MECSIWRHGDYHIMKVEPTPLRKLNNEDPKILVKYRSMKT